MDFAHISRFQPPVGAPTIQAMTHYFKQAKFLFQCHQAKLFEYLTMEPRTVEEIAKTANYRADRLEITLDTMVSVGLVEKWDHRYSLTQESYTYLCPRSSYYSGDHLYYTITHDDPCNDHSLRDWLLGQMVQQGHVPNDIYSNFFVHAMAQGVIIDNSIHKTVDLISGHPCFATAETLLDVGGGHGLFSIALQKRHPGLKATVFDLPQTEPVTAEYAKNCGEEIGFAPGNFYDTKLPGEQDIVLCCDILYPVSVERKSLVMRKIFDALKPGGHFFLKLMYLNEDRTGPVELAFLALHVRVHSDDSYVQTLTEAKTMLENVGFVVEDVFLPDETDSWKIISAVKPL